MRGFRAILLLINLVWFAHAEPPNEPPSPCAVCRQPLPAQHYVMGNPALGEEHRVCEPCARLKTRCFVCGLPVKIDYLKLDDGRLICNHHAKSAVLSQDGAARIFEEVKRDLVGMFSGLGVSPDKSITVFMVNQKQLENLHKSERSSHEKTVTMGFTRTRMKPNSNFEHSIYLLSGLGPSRLKAVCAHEYAHAWLNENMPKDRVMEAEMEEGFCELVAYKLMSLKNDEPEKNAIQSNTYTKGRIDILIRAEQEYQFYRVIDWMKSGMDETIEQTNLARLLVLKERPAASLVWQAPTPTPVPDSLILKGISGTPQRRFALINDRTLEKNERARIRVGSSNVTVRCLDISHNSVLIKLDGSEQKKELFLSTN